jgi:hypothetical protein
VGIVDVIPKREARSLLEPAMRYAISVEERPSHPAIIAIRDAARRELFQETRG